MSQFKAHQAWEPTEEFLAEYPIFEEVDLLPPSGNIKISVMLDAADDIAKLNRTA